MSLKPNLNLGQEIIEDINVTWVAQQDSPLVFGAVVLVVDEERGGVEGRLAETDEVAADAAVDDPLLRDLTQLAVHVEHADT